MAAIWGSQVPARRSVWANVWGSELSQPAWLFATTRNKYPKQRGQTATGGGTGLLSRMPAKIGSGNPTSLRFLFANAYLTSTGEFTDTSTVTIDECALERVTGSTAVAVTFSGSRSATLAPGQFLLSDVIPASAFGLVQFTKGDDYFTKTKARVATAGDFYPGSRNIQEGGTQRAWRYNPSAGTVSAAETFGNFTVATGTPAITNEGTGGNSTSFCPMVIGYYPNGQTKVFFTIGDSIIDGTSLPNDGTWMQYACNTAAGGPYAHAEVSAGGSDQNDFDTASVLYRQLFQYARILVDELGTNGPGNTVPFTNIWTAAKAAGVRRIYKTRLLPRTFSTLNVSALTRVGTTATLTPSTGTLPPVGATVTVASATPAGFNGTFTVTRSGGGSYDYTMAADPGSDCTNAASVRWSDLWTTEANQQYTTAGAPGGANDVQDNWAAARVADGTIDGFWQLDSVRGVDKFKWKSATPAMVNDAWSAFAVGTHPTTAANTTLASEVAPLLDAIIL